MSKQGTCWDGYMQKGMKKKGGKLVPNCVPRMKSGGLTKWFNEKWVDIGSKKKGGGFKECGRKSASGSKRKYPKCVPAAKAARMTESQRRSAVARKRSKAQGVGGKPTNVKTFAARGKLISTAKKYYDSLEKVQINNPNMALQDKQRKKQYDKKNMGGIIDQTRMRFV